MKRGVSSFERTIEMVVTLALLPAGPCSAYHGLRNAGHILCAGRGWCFHSWLERARVLSELGHQGRSIKTPTLTASPLDRRDDPPQRYGDALVFPNDDQGPASGSQASHSLSVSLSVTRELVFPPSCIGPGCHAVPITAVPETTPDLYGDHLAREDDINAPSKSGQRTPVDAESEPQTVQLAAYRDFRRRVYPALRLHPHAHCGRAGETDVPRAARCHTISSR